MCRKALARLTLSAWVLWINSGAYEDLASGKSRWSVLEAYELRGECRTAMADFSIGVRKKAEEAGMIVSVSPEINTLVFTDKAGKITFAQYLCLPEVVDPRPHS